MSIREFRSKDFGAIESIYNASKLDELRFESEKFELLPLSKDEKRLRSLLESKIYVYERDRILGYGAYLGSEIRALFVEPTSRGQGVGSDLLSFMLKFITHPATLYVAKSNEPAKSIYSDFGFKVIEEVSTTYNGISVLANKMLRKG